MMGIWTRGKRRAGLILTVLCLVLLPAASFAAAQTQEELETEALKSLGLFAGSERGDQLHRQPDKVEGTVIFIRLLGEEGAAQASESSHPFVDVPDWAEQYVSYAYEKGLVTGVSETRLGAEEPMSRPQYLALVLRALGYKESDGSDAFDWSQVEQLAQSIGLLDGAGVEPAAGQPTLKAAFSRGDLVRISWRALSAKERAGQQEAGEPRTLADLLIAKGVFTQEQYAAAKVLVAEGPKEVKAVYLTFDDGPNKKVTPRVLDTLAEYDIKATFFVVGKQVDASPQMLQRIYQEGHRIGNHSYDHVYKTLYASNKSLLAGIQKADQSIDRALGFDYKSDIFRFPGGSFQKAQSLKEAALKAGYQYYDWNCSGQDASKKSGSTKAEIIQSVKDTAKGKKDLIVLLHDAAPKSTTADALPEIIEYFMNQGYVFRTLQGTSEK